METYTTKDYYEKYSKAEQDFIEAIIKEEGSGVKIKFATKEQDIHDHYDVIYDGHKVDVKSIKKRNRDDNDPDENIHWVEIRNVQGKNGWLYGEADEFAFETKDYWVLVSKLALQELIKEKVKKEQVDFPQLYKLYRRKNREDVLTLVKTLDLCFKAKKIIKK